MPPKKRKKGRKLSKAQKEKQQQEEEERRLQEEEEARLKAEKEEQERLERERKEKELERLELKDRECRGAELDELRHLLEENHSAVTKWKSDTAETAKWERYMRCDGTPDPSVQTDINTYISLWRDDPEVDITVVLKQCNLALQLIEELEVLLRDVSDPQQGQEYKEALINLQELIHDKHLVATEEILKKANTNIDTETGNMQTLVRDDNFTLCLWANFKKNPWFKGFTFEGAGMGFELPKQLAVSDIAVRTFHTHYDHLSLLVRMAQLRIHTPSSRSLTGGQEAPADIEVPEQGETDGEGEVKNDDDIQQQRAEEQDSEGRGRKSVASLHSRDSGQSAEILTQMEALGGESEEDPTSPPEQLSRTDRGERSRAVDLRQYTPLGGVFYYDVFHLPPQAHHVNSWEIRQLLDAGLQYFHYPTEKSKLDDTEVLTCPPVGVTMTLPESVLFLEAPIVARWDAAVKQWRMDGITDFSHEGEEKKISFKTDSFQAFALMQETYANLPFQKWELRPLGQNSALFTISGAHIDLSITIKGNQCMLQLQREDVLSHLVGRWMDGLVLQKAMLNAGINVFVNEYTDKYVSTCSKDPLTEHAAYEQMALFASACAFSWSKWNAKCGAEHLAMQACEHHGPAPVPEDSWSLYLLGAQRSYKLEMTEKSEAFSADYHPGSVFHSTFIHMLQDDMSAEGVAATRKSNYLFVDTVQSLLCATRPLVYS